MTDKKVEKKVVEKEDKKRSQTDTPPTTHYVETRARKKAREALDLISGVKQRQQSVFNLLGKEYTGPSESQLQMIFRLFCNRQGYIGAEELAAVLRSMGKRPLTKRIDKILNECDANKNGTIEMDEFVEYMQNKAMEKAKMLGLVPVNGDDEDDSEDDEGGDTDEETDTSTPKKKADGAIKAKKTTTKKTATSTSKKAATTTKKTATATATAKGTSKKTPTTSTTTSTTSTSLAKQPSFFAPLKKGTSIVHFYTENAGVHAPSNAFLDKFKNPIGVEYDLGVEGAFTSFTILFGIFYTPLVPKCEADLKSKGFNIIQVKTQKEFLENLSKADVAIIISGKENDGTTTDAEFVQGVQKHHESGRGLFLWADNAPWTVHANLILSKLFGSSSVVTGNEQGTGDLILGKQGQKKTFLSHLITSGIVTLYEGITISSMANKPKTLDVLGTSSQGNAVMLISNSELADNCGRVVVDTGFTKLMDHYYSAGVERYIKNACVWLLSLDHRFRIGVDAQATIEKPREQPVWQYLHGNWYDYDKDASFVTEEAYQDWVKNPYIDVRAVKSGHWQYSIDFKQMKQTNIQHVDHTQRDVRRTLRPVV